MTNNKAPASATKRKAPVSVTNPKAPAPVTKGNAPPASAGGTDNVERLIKLQRQLFSRLRAHTARHWVKSDLTFGQIKVMGFLYTDGPARMSSVAKGMNITLPSAKEIVDRLVERGMVVRVPLPTDRRVVMCSLSAKGTQRVSTLWAYGPQVFRDIFRTLSPAEQDESIRGLQALVTGAERLAAGGASKSS